MTSHFRAYLAIDPGVAGSTPGRGEICYCGFSAYILVKKFVDTYEMIGHKEMSKCTDFHFSLWSIFKGTTVHKSIKMLKLSKKSLIISFICSMYRRPNFIGLFLFYRIVLCINFQKVLASNVYIAVKLIHLYHYFRA